MKCKICKNVKGNKSYTVREMMFGLRDEFEYFQCASCETLQISEFPLNIAEYYPENYYSYDTISKTNFALNKVIQIRNRYAVFDIGLLGSILYKKYPREDLRCLSALSVHHETKILDIGCGVGRALHHLSKMGLKNLLGVDPYNPECIKYENGLEVRNTSVHQVIGKWDIVMFHHSFEHLADPIEVLIKVEELLTTSGNCIIRIPIVSSSAWQIYGTNWVQLDAPRHFYLHSLKSIELLAKLAGLKLWKVEYDSSSFQFWGSELYAKDIPLTGSESLSPSQRVNMFGQKTLSSYKRKSKQLNSEKLGDQAVFYLRKI